MSMPISIAPGRFHWGRASGQTSFRSGRRRPHARHAGARRSAQRAPEGRVVRALRRRHRIDGQRHCVPFVRERAHAPSGLTTKGPTAMRIGCPAKSRPTNSASGDAAGRTRAGRAWARGRGRVGRRAPRSAFPTRRIATPGAAIVGDAAAVFARRRNDREGQGAGPRRDRKAAAGPALFTYLHLAPDREQTQGLPRVRLHRDRLRDGDGRRPGRLPLLAPMSQVAGRMSVQAGDTAWSARRAARACCSAAARRAAGQGGRARRRRLRHQCRTGRAGWAPTSSCLTARWPALDALDARSRRVRTAVRDRRGGGAAVLAADLVIGAVLVPGRRRRSWRRARCSATMQRGSAAGRHHASTRAAASRPAHPTTHEDPTFAVDGVVHYCVANMPQQSRAPARWR